MWVEKGVVEVYFKHLDQFKFMESEASGIEETYEEGGKDTRKEDVTMVDGEKDEDINKEATVGDKDSEDSKVKDFLKSAYEEPDDDLIFEANIDPSVEFGRIGNNKQADNNEGNDRPKDVICF
uniref:Uncharacterized protein n=1 Tax=Vitis vinifera TaxID=29760 RepID=A5B2M9_VITVI|nr:hypothetical protein VITISV_000427 [Vitis vinifera]